MNWIHDLIADKPAGAPAIQDHDGAVFSYGDLRRAVSDMARMLWREGLRPGDRLMIVAENCGLFAAAVMAASEIGAWALPVNARQTGEEMAALARHSGARMMLFTDVVSPAAARRADDFAARKVGDLPFGPVTVTRAVEVQPEPVPDDPGERVGAMLYTTGTTSAPKGVMLSHANLCWNAGISPRMRGMTADDTILAVLPVTHIFGFASTMLGAFFVGSCVRFLPRFDPGEVLAALADGAAVMPAVPQMYAVLLAYLDKHDANIVAPKLHYISAGGAPLDPDLKRRTEAAFGLPLHNGMGMTECSPTMAVTSIHAPSDDISVGKAAEDVELWIDQPDADGVGELMVRSPGVMLGYYHDPEATQEVLQNGILRTGDLARITPDGTVFMAGRIKELIIRSGFNIYPPEIEAMLTRHTHVAQAAVVGRSVSAGNEEIVAFVLGRDGLDLEELTVWLRERLAPYKQPQHLIAVESFPAAATGKILKHKLLDHFADRLPPQA